MDRERLNNIKNRVTQDIEYEDGEWLIERVERLEEALDYVLTAKLGHYHDIKNMLEDFTYVINRTLEGK